MPHHAHTLPPPRSNPLHPLAPFASGVQPRTRPSPSHGVVRPLPLSTLALSPPPPQLATSMASTNPAIVSAATSAALQEYAKQQHAAMIGLPRVDAPVEASVGGAGAGSSAGSEAPPAAVAAAAELACAAVRARVRGCCTPFPPPPLPHPPSPIPHPIPPIPHPCSLSSSCVVSGALSPLRVRVCPRLFVWNLCRPWLQGRMQSSGKRSLNC
jgi:hypothetical protein